MFNFLVWSGGLSQTFMMLWLLFLSALFFFSEPHLSSWLSQRSTIVRNKNNSRKVLGLKTSGLFYACGGFAHSPRSCSGFLWVLQLPTTNQRWKEPPPHRPPPLCTSTSPSPVSSSDTTTHYSRASLWLVCSHQTLTPTTLPCLV